MRTHISTKNKHTFIELKPCGVLCQGSAMNPLLSRQSGKLLAFFLALKHTFLNVVHNSIFGNGGFLFIFLLSQRTSHKKKDYLYLERYSFREDQNILKNWPHDMRHTEQVSINFKGLKSQSMFSNHNAINVKNQIINWIENIYIET